MPAAVRRNPTDRSGRSTRIGATMDKARTRSEVLASQKPGFFEKPGFFFPENF